jgi:hypothetical protein
VRRGPRVERLRAGSLAAALDLLEARARDMEGTPSRAPVDLRVRRFEPVQQVAARAELSGPGRWRPAVRCGVDVRGDGSAEAWTGGVRRALVRPQEGETIYAALRRVVGERAP